MGYTNLHQRVLRSTREWEKLQRELRVLQRELCVCVWEFLYCFLRVLLYLWNRIVFLSWLDPFVVREPQQVASELGLSKRGCLGSNFAENRELFSKMVSSQTVFVAVFEHPRWKRKSCRSCRRQPEPNATVHEPPRAHKRWLLQCCYSWYSWE